MDKTRTVGNYTLVQKLGSGSYAYVYKGVHNTSGETYAVKVIAKAKLGSAKLQENLDSEISIMRDYVHRNIVQLHDHFTSSRHIYLVLEFCGGGDLHQYIRKYSRLSEPVTRSFLVQLAQGLKFLHSKNIIHRDIKPQNLLLTDTSPNAIIKFADFGFAKHLVEASMAQTPCGTPLYMAPEIFEMQEYNAKADLWSLGCVIYEMLVGTTPFRGSNPRELFQNIRSKQLRIPNDITVSADMLQLLRRILEINPLHRITLEAFCEAADRLYAEMSVLPQAPSRSVESPSDAFDEQTNTKKNAPSPIDTELRKESSKTLDQNSRSSSSTGQPIRRIRSREQIGGNGSGSGSGRSSPATSVPPPPPLSSSPTGSSPTHASAGQRTMGVSPATATMILALAGGSQGQGNPGGTTQVSASSGGSQGIGHRRSGSGGSASKEDSYSPVPERRYSVGDASAVSKALSSTYQARSPSYDSATQERMDQHTPSFSQSQTTRGRSSTGMTFGMSGGSGAAGGYNDEGGAADPKARQSSATQSSRRPGGEGERSCQVDAKRDVVDDSDDFVFIEQTAVHPWRALDSNQYTGPTGSSPKAAPAAMSSSGALPQTQWYGNTSGIASMGLPTGTSSSSQDNEMMQFTGVAHLCSYIVNIVMALTSVADSIVRDTLHRQHKLQSRFSDVLDDDDTASVSSGGGSVSRVRAGSADGGTGGTLSEQLCPAFAIYIHAVGFLQDTIQKTVAARKIIHSDSPLQGQIDTLVESLSKRFDQLLNRAESCKKWLSDEDSVPTPEPIVYKHALALGQEASVEELLGNLSKACEKYAAAKLLVESILMTASEPSDKRVLQGFARMFADQFTQCEKAKTSLLEYGEAKVGSPASTSSVDSYRNRSISH